MSNSFCGPYAVGHLLDISIKDACEKIRSITGSRSVFGVARSTMDEIFGDRHYTRGGRAHVTVLNFQRNNADGRYLLELSDHYIVLDGEWIYDNSGCGKAERHHLRRHWVMAAWQIEYRGWPTSDTNQARLDNLAVAATEFIAANT